MQQRVELGARTATNWTTAAGALEGVLARRGIALPRHAIMGITGHAWHFCLQVRDGVSALPGGPHDLDWEAMVQRYARLGVRFERFGARPENARDLEDAREAAIAWIGAHLERGTPVIGFDFLLPEFSVVYGIEPEARRFLVDNVVTGQAGPTAPWEQWPSGLGIIELFAPAEEVEVDADEVLAAAIATAILCINGGDGPAGDSPRGAAGLAAWAETLDGEGEVDRAGNAYTLAVLQAARLDGADFLADLATAIPDLAVPLHLAERAIRDEALALAPLITLFPFPTGGHGNVNTPGLRRAAAMALRRASQHELAAAAALGDVLDLLE